MTGSNLFLIIGSVFLIIALLLYLKTLHFINNAHLVKATVIANKAHRDYDYDANTYITNYQPKYSFYINNKRYTHYSNFQYNIPKEIDSKQLIYVQLKAENNYKIKEKTWWKLYLFELILTPIGCFFLFISEHI